MCCWTRPRLVLLRFPCKSASMWDWNRNLVVSCFWWLCNISWFVLMLHNRYCEGCADERVSLGNIYHSRPNARYFFYCNPQSWHFYLGLLVPLLIFFIKSQEFSDHSPIPPSVLDVYITVLARYFVDLESLFLSAPGPDSISTLAWMCVKLALFHLPRVQQVEIRRLRYIRNCLLLLPQLQKSHLQN